MPYIGNQPGTGVRSRFIYTATASQTTFTGADDNSKTLKYADSDYIDVYLNGVCLVPGTDYTASTKTSVVLTQAASLNDTLEVVAYDIATISDTVSKADGGTFNGDLGITNASPDITLTNNTTEDTDGGRESTVTFKGLQSGGEESTLAEIRASHDATADDQKGDLIFKTNDGNDGASPTEAMRIDSAQNVGIGTAAPLSPFHVSGAGDTGFMLQTTNAVDDKEIWEVQAAGNSSNHADLIFRTRVNAGTGGAEAMRITNGGSLGIGTGVPLRQLSIASTSNAEMSFISGTSSNASILFGDGTTGTDVYRGYIQYGHSSDSLAFATSAAERMRISTNGTLLVGTTGDTTDERVRVSVTSGSKNGISTLATDTNGGTALICRKSTGASVGSVSFNNNNTAFNTSSDYRLKENVTNVSDGITRVKQLAPKRFNWIDDDSNTAVDGFLAHEVQTVVPEAITGAKDEVEVWKDGQELPDGVSVGDNKLDDDGNTIPVIQNIDQSKLVPLLAAALQEAITKIETLETKVAALEAE